MSLLLGDCLEVMPTLEAGSVDAVVTDPPAGIAFMGKTWDRDKGGRTQWVSWMTAVMSECLRVLKPGGWLVCWSLPRTSHWTAWAIEDAGFKLTDVLLHVFASGFPKGRSQMKPAYEPWILARKPGPLRELAIDACRLPASVGYVQPNANEGDRVATHQRGGHAAFHYADGKGRRGEASAERRYADEPGDFAALPGPRGGDPSGRWPANLILTDPIFDGDTPGVVGGGETGRMPAPYTRSKGSRHNRSFTVNAETSTVSDGSVIADGYGDSGTYSRFFLLPKAARSEREPVLGGLPLNGARPINAAWDVSCAKCGRQRSNVPGAACQCEDPEWVKTPQRPRANSHPTVKPLDLMRHLVRLVTPTGGTVLDCFAGSGTTLLAAEMEGFQWIGIERELEYVQIIEARLNGTQRGLGLPA